MVRNDFCSSVLIVLLLSLSNGAHVCSFLVSEPFEAPSALPSQLRLTSHTDIVIRPNHRKNVGWRRRSSGFALHARSNDSDDTTPSSPRVKFSGDFRSSSDNGDSDSSSSLANPLDRFLTLIASDAFSIVSGIIGLLAVVVYRWNLVLQADSGRAAAEALTYQTRTDLLAVLASGSVLLNGVTKLDVTTALAESVVLEGETLPAPEANGISETTTLSWALESLLTATPAKTAILITDDGNDQWTVQYRAGVVPSSPTALTIPGNTPILERVGSPNNSKESYLPTLQALPGRTELTYLPNNAQMAVLIPIQPESSSGDKKNSVLVLGGNTAKSFTPRDIAWSRIVAQKLGEDL